MINICLQRPEQQLEELRGRILIINQENLYLKRELRQFEIAHMRLLGERRRQTRMIYLLTWLHKDLMRRVTEKFEARTDATTMTVENDSDPTEDEVD